MLDNRFTGRVVYTSITPIDDHKTSFKEFPSDPELRHFDKSDRKFVAVSCAHSERPPIWEAVDSKWMLFQNALIANGVTVEFLCPDDIQRLSTASS